MSNEVDLVHADWTPPESDLDETYVEAAKLLLGNGLADPRGGVFSKIKIELGDGAWNHRAVEEGYGWVLPDRKRAVLLDGVEYSHFTDHEPAEIEATLAPMLEPNSISVAVIPVAQYSIALPALLLLVGRSDLLEGWTKRMGARGAGSLFKQLQERYTMLAAEALMVGDDRTGLFWAERLVAQTAVHDSFPHPQRESRLPFAKALLADFQRRVAQPKKEPLDLAAIEKLLQMERIAALIEGLDSVGARQYCEPGEVMFLLDPLVVALGQEGEAAVPSLVDAIENDRRFTRSVGCSRHFWPDRTIHSVKSLAWEILYNIWPSATQVQAGQFRPIPDPQLLREAWRKESSVSQPERWFAVLRDDSAEPNSWAQAALSLVRPGNHSTFGPAKFRIPKEVGSTLSGEPLRATHGDEIAQLMAERAEACLNPRELGAALRIAHSLSRWDLTAAGPILERVCRMVLNDAEDLSKQYAGFRLAPGIGFVLADSLKAGNDSAHVQFEAFLQRFPLKELLGDFPTLRPIWVGADDPKMEAAAKSFFSDWTTQITSSDPEQAYWPAQRAIAFAGHTLMLTVPAFRKLLVAGLENPTVLGSGIANPQRGDIDFMHTSGTSWELKPRKGAEGEEVPVVLNDLLARRLTHVSLKDAPAFHLLGSEAERTAQRIALIVWLQDGRRNWRTAAKTSPAHWTQPLPF